MAFLLSKMLLRVSWFSWNDLQTIMFYKHCLIDRMCSEHFKLPYRWTSWTLARRASSLPKRPRQMVWVVVAIWSGVFSPGCLACWLLRLTVGHLKHHKHTWLYNLHHTYTTQLRGKMKGFTYCFIQFKVLFNVSFAYAMWEPFNAYYI